MPQSNFGLASEDTLGDMTVVEKEKLALEAETYGWRNNMTNQEKADRKAWLAQGRGRKGLRIVIVTGKIPSLPSGSLI